MAEEVSFQYEFADLTGWDRSSGIGPLLLTQARKRARLIAERGMCPELTASNTEFLRGTYAEVRALIKSLEDAGVSEHA